MEAEVKIESRGVFGAREGEAFIIAGPCSAESESQVVQSAVALSRLGRVHALRAGIWKPRTRPDTFEGIGRVGLEWLKSAKAETGLPVAIEVANVKHVYEALKTGVDILWIGARTTTNPFSVQEIAEALKGVSVPVLVKNPVNPDIDLQCASAMNIKEIRQVWIVDTCFIVDALSLGMSLVLMEVNQLVPLVVVTLFPTLLALSELYLSSYRVNFKL